MPTGVHEKKNASVFWHISYGMNAGYYALLSFASEYVCLYRVSYNADINM